MLIFDKDYNLVDLAYEQLDAAYMQPVGNVNKLPMQKLSVSKAIKEPGYVYIYISNEGSVQQDIYFDDLKITHGKSRVVQADDYYPFGLTFNSYQRENSVTNQYQYNGKEMQDELGLAWLDYGARMYMSDIGRWGVIDPLSEKAMAWTPYRYAFDNPVLFIDPDGMFEYSDGYSTQDSRNATGAVSFSGVYQEGSPNGIAHVGAVGGIQSGVGSHSGVSEMEAKVQQQGAENTSVGEDKDSQQPDMPSRAELQDRFGDSFHELFWDPLLDQFEGQDITPQDVENFIEDFDFKSLQDSNTEGYRYELQIAFSKVLVVDAKNTKVLYLNSIDWTNGLWAPLPVSRPPGTAFNPTVGRPDGPIIYFRDRQGSQYAVGILLYVPPNQ